MHTIKTLTEKIGRKVSRKKFYVTQSPNFEEYLRVHPVKRTVVRKRKCKDGKNRSIDSITDTFGDGIRALLIKMFPESSNGLIQGTCAHIKKERAVCPQR